MTPWIFFKNRAWQDIFHVFFISLLHTKDLWSFTARQTATSLIRQCYGSIFNLYLLATDHWAEKLYSCDRKLRGLCRLSWSTLITLYGYVKLVTRHHLLSPSLTLYLVQGQLYFYQNRLLNSQRFHIIIIPMKARPWQKKFNFRPSITSILRRLLLEWPVPVAARSKA